MSADLDPARIASLLETARYGRSIDVRALTESTNDDARRAAEAGAPDGHVVVADAQTRGRGRQGRAWSSPAGTDLYFSVVARPGLTAATLPPLTLAVGVALAETAEALAGARALVKWPNDVWIDRRKVAGILVETSTHSGTIGAVVIGVGLDVNRTEWPDALRPVATSLREARGAPLDRAEVLCATLRAIETWIDRLVETGPAPIVAALDQRLALRGERVSIDDTEGELLGITDTGALRVGSRTFLAGDLSTRGRGTG